MAGGATAAANSRGRHNSRRSGDGKGDLSGGTLFTLPCQQWWMKAVGGGGSSGGRRSAADNSVDGSGRRVGCLFPCCRWRRRGNRRRTMDNCRLKTGVRQNNFLTKLYDKRVKVR
jgi:hypothetical protein